LKKVKLEHDVPVSVIWYDNLDSRSFKNFSRPNWSELINRLAIPQINNNKYVRGVAVYGDIADSNDYKKYRSDDNVKYRDVIVLDYDEISDLKALNEAIKSELEGVAWFWHSTYSHHTDSPRIRLFIPLNEHISADDYRKYSKVIAYKIGHKVDGGSYQPSRAMALPVIKDNSHIFLKAYNDAAILGVERLKEWSKDFKESSKPLNVQFGQRRNAEYWKSIAFGVGKGGRNSSLASLIGHLLNHRVNEYIIYSFALMWGQSCTPPMKEKEINTTFQSILKKHYSN